MLNLVPNHYLFATQSILPEFTYKKKIEEVRSSKFNDATFRIGWPHVATDI